MSSKPVVLDLLGEKKEAGDNRLSPKTPTLEGNNAPDRNDRKGEAEADFPAVTQMAPQDAAAATAAETQPGGSGGSLPSSPAVEMVRVVDGMYLDGGPHLLDKVQGMIDPHLAKHLTVYDVPREDWDRYVAARAETLRFYGLVEAAPKFQFRVEHHVSLILEPAALLATGEVTQ